MADSEDTTATIFEKYQTSFASRLRYTLAQQNLTQMHDLDRPLRVLDCASGNGLIAEFLLRQGHSVTLLDSDPEMLTRASERIQKMGLSNLCRIIEGKMESTSALLPDERFDLILCHHALEYTKKSRHILKEFRKVASSQGELSLITLNPVSEVIRAILFRKDPSLANLKLTDRTFDAKFFGHANLLSLEEITVWAEEAGWDLSESRAIRVLADYMGREELAALEEENLLQLEFELGCQEPYWRFGRYLQFSFRLSDR